MTDERRRLLGIALLAVGGLAALIGAIGLVTSGDTDEVLATQAAAAAPTTQTQTTSAPTSALPQSTTTTTTTTTTVAAVTTTAPTDEVLMRARTAVGTYQGEWVNLTFGSTGPITVEVTLDEATRVVTFTFDLGGNVFGGADPPPISFDLDIDEGSSEITSPLFGDVTVSIDQGNVLLSAQNIPAPGISSMNVTGVVDPSGSNLEYEIAFDDGGTANGTLSLGSVVPPEGGVTETTTAGASGDQTVEEFFVDYVAAIESGDVDFLFDRLHPVVLAQPSADLCRAFIEREILALGNYRIAGDVTGPVSQNVAGTTVPGVFSVPVSFDFQGQSFDGTATFAAVDGQMHWFTECR